MREQDDADELFDIESEKLRKIDTTNMLRDDNEITN